MRFALFFAVLFALLSGLSYYVHRRASLEFNVGKRGRLALFGVLAFGMVAMTATRVLGSTAPSIAKVLGTAGNVVTLGVILSAVLLAVVDIPRSLVRRAARVFAPHPPSAPLTPTPLPEGRGGEEPATGSAPHPLPPLPEGRGGEEPVPDKATSPVPVSVPVSAPAPIAPLPRRTFLSQAAASSAFLIGGGSSVYGALVGRHDYTIEEVAIPIPGLPKALDGYTLVQLSDIHVGLYVGEPELAAAEELVRKVRADQIVLTGDLIDFDPRYAPVLGTFARRLAPLARDGVTAIPGNHDYFTGIDVVLSTLTAAGAHVLKNSGRVIGDAKSGFALLGVDDVWATRSTPKGGPDLARTLASVPKDLARVLLCHNPSYFPEAAGEVALQLSGHTHGGQVNLVLEPAQWVLPYGYVKGLYQRGSSRLYVNRGFGTAGPPARIGAPPEVTKVVLVSA